jgi:uncharacterized protein (DUF1778 family)
MKKDPKRPRFQIDASKKIRDYVKALAYQRGMSMTEFVLTAMANAGDQKLKKLVAEELKNKTQEPN